MRVVFVTMPFGGVRPAIGPSLLVSHLRRLGVEARVEYLNLAFAKRIGGRDYTFVSDHAPTQSLAGDWVFSASLFGPRPDADSEYEANYRERFGRYRPPETSLATLRRAREQVEPFLEECLQRIDWPAYDLVGFSSTFTQHVASLSLARRLKLRYPNLIIAFGGANCEDEMGSTLHESFPFVDFVFSGEADISLPRLVETLLTGADTHGIPGVISRRDGRSTTVGLLPERVRNLDDLPYPDFEDYFAQQATTYPGVRLPRRILMESSRGCWWGEKHHCTFCGLNGMAMTYRSKSAGRLLAELNDLAQRYQAEHVEMVDNILDMGYFADVLPEIARLGLKLELFYETKANLRKDQLRMLRAAGVTAIQPGIESFSSSVLQLMRKGTSAAQNVQLLKWCAELGIRPAWNLLYGFPGENPDEYAAMASLIDGLSHLAPPQGFGAIRLDRFSPNFIDSTALGLTNVRPDRSYRLIYDLPDEQLAGLAYYFEHDYQDGRDPGSYVGATSNATRRWQQTHRDGDLVSVDHGDRLAIWDFRPGSSQRLTILSGVERLLYLYCDQHHTFRALEQFLAESETPGFALAPFLEELLHNRLAIALDGRYLGLAVPRHGQPAITPAAPESVGRRNLALVEHQGVASSAG